MHQMTAGVPLVTLGTGVKHVSYSRLCTHDSVHHDDADAATFMHRW